MIYIHCTYILINVIVELKCLSFYNPFQPPMIKITLNYLIAQHPLHLSITLDDGISKGNLMPPITWEIIRKFECIFCGKVEPTYFVIKIKLPANCQLLRSQHARSGLSSSKFFLAQWWGDEAGAWEPMAVMSMHYKLLTLAGNSTARRRQ